MRPWKWVWHTFGYKLCQKKPITMKLKLVMSCHLLNLYTKFQNDIAKHVGKKSGKLGWTDGHCQGILRPFLKRAYKKWTRNYFWMYTDSCQKRLCCNSKCHWAFINPGGFLWRDIISATTHQVISLAYGDITSTMNRTLTMHKCIAPNSCNKNLHPHRNKSID